MRASVFSWMSNYLATLVRRVVLLLATGVNLQLAVAQVVPPAVLNPGDASLRLWLRSDTLVTAGLTEGSPVTQWIDQSQYGTILAPRTVSNPNGPLGGFPVEENPHLRLVDINGHDVPTVRFDRNGDIFMTGDPNMDGSGSTDRLYQTNNLDNPNTPETEFDPLNIGDGSSLTTFVVFNPDVTTSLHPNGSPILGQQIVFAKRGTNSSVYELGIKNFPNFGNFVFVSYDSVEAYHSGVKPKEKVWHITSITIEDMPGSMDVDVLDIRDDESQSEATKMVSLGATRANGTPASLIANRNASTPEPFGLGGHSQNCCGEGETFAGNIAEVIIFARTLTAQEYADVENYLDAKYFATTSAGVSGDYSGNGSVDAADYVLFRKSVGQSISLANENPSATTPGIVDDEDYNFWRANFGSRAGSGALANAVPEPESCLVLCSILCAGWLRIRVVAK
jgi:hypothetical protein